MELRQLRTFVTAAEVENFTRAARALGVTQPAVSQQVASLEQELGVALFRRQGRSIKLTPHGRRFYSSARHALDLLDEASREVAHAPTSVAGTLHIASCTIAPETFLPELMAAFRRAYPDVHETVSVSDTETATRAVERGTADLAYVVVRPAGGRLRSQHILCHELVLVASPEHPLAKRDAFNAEQLRAEAFILRERGSGTRKCVEQALLEAGISPEELKIALETNSNDAVRGAVREGEGIAFLSPAAVADDFAQGRLAALSIDGLHVRLDVYLVRDCGRMPTPAVRAFLGLQGSSALAAPAAV